MLIIIHIKSDGSRKPLRPPLMISDTEANSTIVLCLTVREELKR